MDLRQYLIAPHEQSQQQPARQNTPALSIRNQSTENTLGPRLVRRSLEFPTTLLGNDQTAVNATHLRAEIGDYSERIQHLQQQQQQQQVQSPLLEQQFQLSQHEAITREQVIRGLTLYPDVLAAILRSGHTPSQITGDAEATAQHPDTLSIASQPASMTLVQRPLRTPSQHPHSTTPSSPIPPSNPSLLSAPIVAKIPKLCFWHYHHGSCTNDPSSPSYNLSGRTCPYLHDVQGMQEIEVQQGRYDWHRGLGDCGLELCRFSNNYKFKDAPEAEDRKNEWSRERRKERKRAARAGVVDGLDGNDSVGVTKPRAEDQGAVNSSSQFILNQDTASATLSPVLPAIPTSPRAGRYAKGNRRQQFSASSPTPSTNKRKANVLSQSTSTPASKKPKPSGPTPTPSMLTTEPQSSTSTPLSKKAAKRLKRLDKKSQAIITWTVATPPSTIVSSTPAPTPQACEIIPSSLPSSLSTSLSAPLSSRPSLTNKSFMVKREDHNKPHHATCFAWYHGSCSRKGRHCKELHALTRPPSFVSAPRGFVHQGGVCGLEWCGGDWRGDQEEDEGDDEEGDERFQKESDVGEGEGEDITAEEVDKASVGGDDGEDVVDERSDEQESADEMVD